MTAREQVEPTLWKPESAKDRELKRKLDACEKENQELTDLVTTIGDNIIVHVKRKI